MKNNVKDVRCLWEPKIVSSYNGKNPHMLGNDVRVQVVTNNGWFIFEIPAGF
ncbi:MAG: hypothetical protein LBK53_09270 [Heliobacteriaceae bacterium]|jgi:hypothetical protein|nr:hypothetical protein [Heliobacteriaceae bacterium]